MERIIPLGDIAFCCALPLLLLFFFYSPVWLDRTHKLNANLNALNNPINNNKYECKHWQLKQHNSLLCARSYFVCFPSYIFMKRLLCQWCLFATINDSPRHERWSWRDQIYTYWLLEAWRCDCERCPVRCGPRTNKCRRRFPVWSAPPGEKRTQKMNIRGWIFCKHIYKRARSVKYN